ncbi:MAG TPA: hypothetical protein P5163_08720, partial [Rubrivivax sp.]|nr:hypothetical protein [Rubrivivax sp.]
AAGIDDADEVAQVAQLDHARPGSAGALGNGMDHRHAAKGERRQAAGGCRKYRLPAQSCRTSRCGCASIGA